MKDLIWTEVVISQAHVARPLIDNYNIKTSFNEPVDREMITGLRRLIHHKALNYRI